MELLIYASKHKVCIETTPPACIEIDRHIMWRRRAVVALAIAPAVALVRLAARRRLRAFLSTQSILVAPRGRLTMMEGWSFHATNEKERAAVG